MSRTIDCNLGQTITLTHGSETITYAIEKIVRGVASVVIEAPGRFEIDDGTEESNHRRQFKTRTKRATDRSG